MGMQARVVRSLLTFCGHSAECHQLGHVHMWCYVASHDLNANGTEKNKGFAVVQISVDIAIGYWKFRCEINYVCVTVIHC